MAKFLSTLLSGRWRFATMITVFLLTKACGGGGCSSCSCMDPLTAPFPEASKVDYLMQLRVTESGIGFIEQNLKPILNQFLPTGLAFDIPYTQQKQKVLFFDVTIDICKNGCKITADLLSADLQPKDPNQIAAEIHAKILPTKIDVKVSGIGVSCDVNLQANDLPINADVFLNTFPASGNTEFDIKKPAAGYFDINKVDIKIQGSGGVGNDIVCGLVDLLKGLFISQLTGSLDDTIDDFTKEGLCATCDKGELCPAGSTCDGKLCQHDNKDGKCAQMPLGVEGRLDLSEALADFAPGITAQMDMSLVMGGGGDNPYVGNNGLSLRMHGGVLDVPNDCVTPQPPPTVTTPPQFSLLFSNNDDQGNPVHLSVGVADGFLDLFGWAAYQSGMLCLNVGYETVPQLQTSLISILVPSLEVLSDGASAPVLLGIRPGKPIEIDVGEGELAADGTQVSPLLNVVIPEFSLDFYAYVYDRYIRLFTVLADLHLPIALQVDTIKSGADAGKLGVIPVFPTDLGKGIRNVRVENLEALNEKASDIEKLLPTLLDVAIPQLLGSLKDPIALPDLQGFALVNPQFKGLDTKPAAEPCTIDPAVSPCHEFLAVLSSLAFNPSGVQPLTLTTQTWAELDRIEFPELAVIREAVSVRDMPLPQAIFRVGANPASGEPVEYAYRVNGGPWSMFAPAPSGEITVRQPAFLLMGRHKVEIVSRHVGAPRTIDLTPEAFSVVMDPLPPRTAISIDEDAGMAYFSATDEVTPDDHLVYEVALQGGAWRNLGVARDVDIRRYLASDLRVELRVTDEAGNRGVSTFDRKLPFTAGDRAPKGIAPTGMPAPVRKAPPQRLGADLPVHAAEAEPAGGIEAPDGREAAPGTLGAPDSGCACSTKEVRRGSGYYGILALAAMLAFFVKAFHGMRRKRAALARKPHRPEN